MRRRANWWIGLAWLGLFALAGLGLALLVPVGVDFIDPRPHVPRDVENLPLHLPLFRSRLAAIYDEGVGEVAAVAMDDHRKVEQKEVVLFDNSIARWPASILRPRSRYKVTIDRGLCASRFHRRHID